MRDGKTARRQDGKRIVGATQAPPAFRSTVAPLSRMSLTPNPSASERPSSPALLPAPRGEGSRSPSPVSDGPGTREAGVGQGGEGKRRGVGAGEGPTPSSPQPTLQDSPSRRLAVLPSSMRAGIDIGGTFTDLAVYDDASGAFVVGKTLTTPDDPSVAIEVGLDETLASANAAMDALGQIIHGTTLVTNALIERKGASTALLASEGFRDSLEIGREHRYDLYDLQLEMPRPLVPRELRFGVPGRTLADGSTLPGHDLDEGYVERLAGELAAAGIEAVAIAFLNSFANPELERRAREAVYRAAPDIRVSISSDGAGDPRVRADLDDGGQRLRPGSGRALPARSGGAAGAGGILRRAAAADLLRRPGHGRDGRAFSGAAAGEWSRRGRSRRRGLRGRRRLRGPPLL